MKHSKEEKQGLRIERIIINSILILSFFSSSLIHSQIPVNGFCGFKEFQVKPNQVKFIPVDFNSDGWRDFITFNQTEKNYSTYTWNKNKLSASSTRYFSISLFDLHIAGPDDSRGKKYAYLSRRDREAGFVSFSKSGGVSILSKLKFDSYPSNIDVADINKNGRSEILISGSNFNGLSIISEDKSKLTEQIVDKNNLYSYSSFVDLDYDGYNDIVAIDLLKNTAVIFNNNRSGGFYQTRSIGLRDDLTEFKIADLNSDGYSDLIFATKDGFELFLGDSVSTFRKKLSINTNETPDKYTILDFNGDGYNDIAYINKESGRLFVSFAKSTNEFYPPIVYFERKGIVDVVSFIDRSGRKIAVLDLTGKIYLIERVTEIENSSIALALKPGIVGTFSLPNSKIKGLYVLDNNQMKIHFLLSRNGLFDTYHSRNLSGSYSNVTVDEIKRAPKTFYFYSKGENVIEMLRINFTRSESSKRVLYTNGTIHDLKITSDRVKDMQTIFVLTENDSKLYIERFDFRDFRYLSSGAEEISPGIEQASLAFSLYKEIYHITKNEKDLLLKKSVFNRKVQSEETLLTKQISNNSRIYSDVESFSDESINENLTASWFSDRNITDLYLYIRKRLNKITFRDFTPTIGSMKYFDGEDENSLLLYDGNKGKLRQVDVSSLGRIVNVSDIFESKSINSYIVDRLIGNKDFLIYSDSSDNLIKIKTLR